MPNIKSAEKRVKVTKAKTMQNSILKSALKSQVRKCKEAIADGSADSTVLSNTEKALDKAVSKGILHKNTAARKKSRLAKSANAVNNSSN